MKSALSIRCQATLNTNEAGFDNLLITLVCVCVSEMAALLTEAVKEPLLRQAQSRDKERDLLLKAGGPQEHTHTHTHARVLAEQKTPADPHPVMNHTGPKEWCLNIFVCFFIQPFFPNQECTSFFPLFRGVLGEGGKGGAKDWVREQGVELGVTVMGREGRKRMREKKKRRRGHAHTQKNLLVSQIQSLNT